ncbi:ribose ABC transporter substrate-binding protein RbsB [Clostridiaceae bacterium UIB06]|uniref:Ribose ABC transporter substrate-binding protein RbsB n=1 Tax=Clostridium thailandense TaxID=2794346 RepID=A0A949TVN7_9CLOT|nr:ribose ABC transporter substrate-binding protein RbsB [Clostridium thailandense]MBV7273293.1 ribose ABC transporter substrate-binding protein RbsB [Clostridium thailandense]MCH5137318.1 ribose ABC transporter substrate-binding protein RbsB [Clostridiaceae bacterium UIB06]
MKRTRLTMLSLALTGIIAMAGFTGCGNKAEQQGAQGGDKKKIGMVVSTLNNPFFVSMKDGATKKAKELGYNLVVVDSQNDASKERSNVDDLLQQGVAAIIINPTDSDAVGNSIKAANDKKIPVLTVDRKANTGDVVTHIASDNVKGGKMAADFILEKLGGKANIVELQGLPGASATRDRGKGFHEGVDNKANVKVVASQAADFDRQKGLNVMENIMQATPQFDAVFAHNDEMALGAVKALKGKKVLVVGFDGNDDAKKAVESGDMAATVAQQPDLMGSLAVENAVKVIKGESVQKEIPVDLKLIKK